MAQAEVFVHRRRRVRRAFDFRLLVLERARATVGHGRAAGPLRVHPPPAGRDVAHRQLHFAADDAFLALAGRRPLDVHRRDGGDVRGRPREAPRRRPLSRARLPRGDPRREPRIDRRALPPRAWFVAEALHRVEGVRSVAEALVAAGRRPPRLRARRDEDARRMETSPLGSADAVLRRRLPKPRLS